LKITAVKLRQVRGTMPTEGPFWEERLVRPVDVYQVFRKEQHLGEYGRQIDDRSLEVEAFFLTIETDDGVRGVSGPFRAPCAHFVATQLRPVLLGQDPLATEYLWDVIHRLMVHGRQGEAMFALSVVDCALWDLKGKWLGQPVWRILGGPTREEIPAYASMLGYAVLDPGRVRERAVEAKEQGFRAQKWFFRHGPMSGHEGLKKNVELVRTLSTTLEEHNNKILKSSHIIQ
jgi:L-alanine-DL-glutamate epimerase-like enolase superfamily enzyme